VAPPPGHGPVAPPPEENMRLSRVQVGGGVGGGVGGAHRASTGVTGAEWTSGQPAIQSSSALARPLGPSTGAQAAQPRQESRPEPDGDETGTDQGWRRVVRAATLGLIEPGAAAAMERERLLVAHTRTRQSGPRMVAFVSGAGGVGTTTTAIGVGLTLATVRGENALLLDARSGTGSLGRRVAGKDAPTTAQLAAEPGRVPPLAYHNLHLVDGPQWHSPTARPALVQLLETLRGQFPFTVVDAGNDAGEPAQGAFGLCDQVVVVTAATAGALDATRAVLERVQQSDPYRLASAAVALICLPGHNHRPVARSLAAELGVQETRIVAVPFDRALVAGGLFDPARLRAPTREAYLRLAARVAHPMPVPRPQFAQAGAGR
jgi:MinD-like ATPase involved in chromosome partitioning or flagellar assembly